MQVFDEFFIVNKNNPLIWKINIFMINHRAVVVVAAAVFFDDNLINNKIGGCCYMIYMC